MARRALPASPASVAADHGFMQEALRLARRALGNTSPNPLVGAVLTRGNRILGRGYHHRAGQPHAEIEALRDAAKNGERVAGATLYVTLEPCCTHGRTPPCTDAIRAAGLRRVVVAATDPNPHHAGLGFGLLQAAGITVTTGVLAIEAARLNEAFNHWITERTPFVTLKIALTLDGKIATAAGDSKWLTGESARRQAHRLRRAHDAILVGRETVQLDNPALNVRLGKRVVFRRRIVLDSQARSPLSAQLLNDDGAAQTTVIVGESAPARRVAALAERVTVWRAPLRDGRIDLVWLMTRLGAGKDSPPVTSLLVEGGGEVHASFLAAELAHRYTAFLAPKILGGAAARRAVGGEGFSTLDSCPRLTGVETRRFGPDLQLSGRILPGGTSAA